MRKADLSLPANEMAALRFHRVLQLLRKEPHFRSRLSIPNRLDVSILAILVFVESSLKGKEVPIGESR